LITYTGTRHHPDPRVRLQKRQCRLQYTGFPRTKHTNNKQYLSRPSYITACQCGVTPLQHALHPTNHVQQDTPPTDNLSLLARRNGAGEAQRRDGRRRGMPPSTGLHRPLGMRPRPAPAPATPLTRHSPQHTPLQTTHIAGNQHTACYGHRPEDSHDTLTERVDVPREKHADSIA